MTTPINMLKNVFQSETFPLFMVSLFMPLKRIAFGVNLGMLESISNLA